VEYKEALAAWELKREAYEEYQELLSDVSFNLYVCNT
jgi:hypothetical protein